MFLPDTLKILYIKGVFYKKFVTILLKILNDGAVLLIEE